MDINLNDLPEHIVEHAVLGVKSQTTLDSRYLLLSGGTLTGNLLFTDNLYDIGASGATRPRTGYFGTSVVTPLIIGTNIKPSANSTTAIQLQNAAGTSIFNVDTTNGNVGIGTTSPSNRLHIVSDALNKPGLLVTGGNNIGAQYSYSGQILIGDSSVKQGSITMDAAAGYLYIDNSLNSNTGNIYFRTKTSGTPVNAVTILGSGNVGIGTTGPGAKLMVNQGAVPAATVQGGIILDSTYQATTSVASLDFWIGGNSNGAARIGVPTISSSGELAFYTTTHYASTPPTEKVRITGVGNVGIGTTSPTYLLSLGGQADRIIWLERNVTAATAGKALSILAGGCVAGGTNLASGILKIGGQLATGSGNSEVQIIGTNGTNNGATADTTPAVMVDVINNKIGLFGVTPVVRPTALTAQLTTITATAPGTPDYAIADLTQTTPFGFVSADEGQSVLKVIANLQVRVQELETKLQSLGVLT